MFDEEVRKRRRATSIDPSDSGARTALIAARARREGAAVYLEPLAERERWQGLPSELQDHAIEQVGRHLGARFQWLGTHRYECATLSHRIASFRHQGSGLELLLLPGGRFSMGSEDGHGDELPQHEVTVPPFLLSRAPVTQQQWDRIRGKDRRFWNGADLPIETVSWYDCKSWLERAGDGLRLSSEAEWEYACRAGSTTCYFWGETMEPARCCP